MKNPIGTSILIISILFLFSCNNSEKNFKEAESLNTILAYQAFIKEFPESTFVDSAKNNIMELNYVEIVALNTLEGFEQFLNTYPTSKFTEEARKQHESLLWLNAKDKNTIGSYEQYLTTYSNGIFGNKIKVEFSEEWFSEIIPCNNDLAPISQVDLDINQNTTYGLKSFSFKGPQRTRKISNGTYVFMPDPEEGTIVVSGTAETTMASIKKHSNLQDWDYIYSDSTQSSLQGWAVVLTSGELILPSWIIDDGPSDRFVTNHFEITEYCNGSLLIKLNPEKNHKIFLENPDYGLPFFTLNYPGTVIQIKERTFIRQSDGWYFSIDKVVL